MIVRPRPTLFQLFFILRGSVVPRIAPQILLIGAISVAVEGVYQLRPNLMPPLNPTPFTLLGLALSIFLGFRNNACYDRWWEARRQWGELVFAARALARQTLLLEPSPEPGASAAAS